MVEVVLESRPVGRDATWVAGDLRWLGRSLMLLSATLVGATGWWLVR